MSESSELSNRQEGHSGSLEQWKQVRSLIEHEDEVTHQRLTWLFNSQALLFAAFALIFQALINKNIEPEYIQTTRVVLAVTATVGIATCLFIQTAVNAAVEHSSELSRRWREHNEDWKPHPPIRGEFTKRPYTILHSRFLPCVFIGSWLALGGIIIANLIHPAVFLGLLLGLLLAYGGFWLFGPEKKTGSSASPRQSTDASTERGAEAGSR